MSTVMLAQSKPAVRKRLSRLLTRHALDVEPVADGRTVVARVEAEQPDIVLLDLNMPRMDGADVIRKIRETGNNVPIVVMAPRREEALGAIREGAADYLATPFHSDDLLIKVRKALAAKKPAATLEIPLRELHDPKSGRIDAKRLAKFLAVPLARLAASLDVLPATAHKSPSAPSLQETLRPIKRAADLVMRATGSPRDARAWLNNPHPDLDGRAPLDVILSGHADAVTTLLENALAGLPG